MDIDDAALLNLREYGSKPDANTDLSLMALAMVILKLGAVYRHKPLFASGVLYARFGG